MRTECVLDTHAWTVYVTNPDALPKRARRLVTQADQLHVPAYCLREVAVLAERGNLRTTDPEMSIDRWMTAALADPCVLAPLTRRVALESASLQREGFHRDPADQLIYATARVLDVPLITGDRQIHQFEEGLPKKVRRLAVWD